MSRGRGGPSREHYHRHPPPDLQAKENYHRPGPASLYPRPGPQQNPYSSYYHNPARPVVPIQSPAPSLVPSAPPIPNHNKVSPKPVALDTHNQYQGPSPGPNSFQYQQVEFLRGQSSEAPQFRASPRGGGGGGGVVPGRHPSSSYQPQSSYSRYPNPNSSPRGRGGYCQDQSFAYTPNVRAPRGTPGPLYLNQNQLQGKNHNQYSNRQWCVQTDSLCDNFQNLSLHRDWPNRGGERFDRHSASSSSANSSFTKVDITLTPDIQDQVHRALAALKPSESISAKVLAKKLRLPKKIVNKSLYSLERSRKASKQGLHPPEWTLYRQPLRGEEDQNSKAQSPPSHLCVSSEQPPAAKVELKTETAENRGQTKGEDSDTESSSSNCSSLESSDSEESQSPAKGQRQEKQHPHSTSSPDQGTFPTMAEQKELVLQYLLRSGEANALVIAKNLGLRNAKQVNPTLYSLEKQGEVIKNGEVNPPTWELSNRRKERMERSLKAAQSTPAEGDQMELEASRDEKGGGSVFLPSPPVPPIPGLEPLSLPEGWMPEQSHSVAVGKIFLLTIFR